MLLCSQPPTRESWSDERAESFSLIFTRRESSFRHSSVLAFNPSHLVAKTLFSASFDGRVSRDACRSCLSFLSLFFFLCCRVVFFSNYVTPVVWSDNSRWRLQEKKIAQILLWAVNVKSLFASYGKVLQTRQAPHQQPVAWKERFTKRGEIRARSLSYDDAQSNLIILKLNSQPNCISIGTSSCHSTTRHHSTVNKSSESPRRWGPKTQQVQSGIISIKSKVSLVISPWLLTL